MRPPEVAVAMAMAVAVVALRAVAASSAAAGPAPAALRLERALPHKGVRMEYLMERDRARHARRGLLGGSSSVAGVVDFPVEGSANPYMVGWVSCFAFWIGLCCSYGDWWKPGKFKIFSVSWLGALS
jgi:kinase